MPLTQEQIKELKKQLLQQISHLPAEQKARAEAQIEAMSPESLESMLKQQQTHTLKSADKSIFRLIAEHEVEAYIVEENKHAIAVLDINPLSPGHVLVIPKEAVTKGKSLPSSVLSLGQKLAKRLTKTLNAAAVELQTEYKFGETILHLIPVYDKPISLNSERHSAKPEELKAMLARLALKKKLPTIRLSRKLKEPSQVLKIPRRIP